MQRLISSGAHVQMDSEGKDRRTDFTCGRLTPRGPRNSRSPRPATSAWRAVFIGGIAFAGLAGPLEADTPESPDALAREIEQIVADPAFGKMKRGVRVEQIHPVRRLIYEHDADQALKPASNMKVISSAAALDVMGRDFTYRTFLAQRGSDLIIIGAGDPSIGDPRIAQRKGGSITQDLHLFVDALEKLGVQQVPGNLLFDDYIFDQEHVHPSWQGMFNLESWYAAPVGGLNFNDNCVDVVIKPAGKIGDPAEVTLIPNTPWVKLDNQTQTSAKGQPIVTRHGDGPITIRVKGPVSTPNSREHPISVAVVDPGAFFASTLRTVLATRGVRVVGDTRRERIRREDGSLPEDVRVIAVVENSLGDILWRMNRSSMNVFAEAIFKSLGAYGAEKGRLRTGTNASAREIIEQYLQRRDIPYAGCVFDDGSGLSHDNRCTATAIVAVLADQDALPERQAWWDDLAIPGDATGTLRNRLQDLEDVLRAKTGTIRGVSALSGYVVGPEQQRYAFSILCNDTHLVKGGSSTARRMQDRIIRALAGNAP